MASLPAEDRHLKWHQLHTRSFEGGRAHSVRYHGASGVIIMTNLAIFKVLRIDISRPFRMLFICRDCFSAFDDGAEPSKC